MTTEASKKPFQFPADLKGAGFPSSNVPGFLYKLWQLVEDKSTNELIRWSPTKNSFIVQDQTRFAKEILPKFFKHSNMASFVRQLNMYGFRKKLNIEHGSLKVDSDDIEFQHPNFLQGRPNLLENIKRKVSVREESKLKMEDVHQILTDVQDMKGKQDNISGTLESIQRENQVLWREVVFLRQRHEKQQKIVNRLIEFLLTMVKPVGLKRKQQLMIEGTSDQAKTKYARLAPSSDNMQLVQPVTFDTDLDCLPNLNQVPSSVVLSDITDAHSALGPQTDTSALQEGATALASEVMPATLDPSLFELDIPQVSPAQANSPVVTTPPSVQTQPQFPDDLWQPFESESQPDPEMASLLSADGDGAAADGGQGSSSSTSAVNPGQFDALWTPALSEAQPGGQVAPMFSGGDQPTPIGAQTSVPTAFPSSSGANTRAVMKRMVSHEEQRDEIGDHVTTVQDNLDMIQHMLTSSVNLSNSYNLDIGSLLEIFSSDKSGNTNDTDIFPMLADSTNTTNENPDDQDNIKGNEIVQYNQLASDSFPSYDEDSLLQSLDDDAKALQTT